MKRFVALLLVAVMAAGACGDDTETSDPPSADPVSVESTEVNDFYDVPDPLPSREPGTLIRYEVIADYNVNGATAYRIMYLSRSALDEPVAVTGIALIPPGETSDGGRRLVTIAHGTTGVADSCAPSKDPRATEMSLMGGTIEQGVITVMSDYEGLGTPRIHPYLVAASEAHSVLDAARAARELPDADAGTRFAIAGYSQGGHAALAASAEAATYAPELELVGTFAGAPPSEMGTILSAGSQLPQGLGFVMMMVAGVNEAYPDAELDLVLTPDGVDQIDAVENGCVSDVLNHFATVPGAQLFKPNAASVEPWASRLRLSDVGHVKVDSPILIIHSKVDDVVPEALSRIIFDRMCRLGQLVDRRLYEEGDHGQAALRALPEAITWITDRFDGKPAMSTCTP